MNAKFKFILIGVLFIYANGVNAGLVDRLTGVWLGEGKQAGSQWTIKFTAENGLFKIDYPSLSCSGIWTVKSQSSGSVTFTETIETGVDRCVDQGTVELLWLEKNKLRYTYYLPSGFISASGELACIECNINANSASYINGKMNIPNIDVYDIFGGVETYEVNFSIVPASNPLKFELLDAHLK